MYTSVFKTLLCTPWCGSALFELTKLTFSLSITIFLVCPEYKLIHANPEVLNSHVYGISAFSCVYVHTYYLQQPTVTSLLQLQHKSSVFMRGLSIPEEEPTLTATESTTNSVTSYGPLGQVECPLDNLKGLEKVGEWHISLCL